MNDHAFENDEKTGPAPDAVSSERTSYLAERVYLIDDDLAVLKVIDTMLSISGYEVRAYSSPSEFLDDSEQLPPGVVVTDQVMKPFDRTELLAAVKEAFRQLKHADSFDEVLPPVLPSGESYLDRLSLRKRDVILLIYRGCTNKSTGIPLGISYKTVEKHRSSAMRKLEVSSMASLVRLLDRDLGRQ